jgi:hypothetical protein
MTNHKRLDELLAKSDTGVKNLGDGELKELHEAIDAFESERKADAARAGGTEPDSPAKTGPVPSAEQAARERMIARHRAAWKEPSPEIYPDNKTLPDSGTVSLTVNETQPDPPATKQDAASPRHISPPRADGSHRLDDVAARAADGEVIDDAARAALIGYVDGLYGADEKVWGGKSDVYVGTRFLWARADKAPAPVVAPLDHSKDRRRQDMVKRLERLGREG